MENNINRELIDYQVKFALQEDVGQQDITAELIPSDQISTATLITRQKATLCGTEWFSTVFNYLDKQIDIEWLKQDGDKLTADSVICKLHGNARNLLTGERTAINFLQTLSGTATTVSEYVDAVDGLDVQILDTRKTLPGWRLAQKYAVKCGGGHNHRFGLYDGILIKENHIMAAGSIALAVTHAKSLNTSIPIEVEVESLDELQQAIDAGADIVLLDNFSLHGYRQAVELNANKALLEASGGITLDNVREVARTGVNRISIGALTKDIQAVDLSLRFE